MQYLHTPDGDGVALMEAEEVLVVESALSRYVLENPRSRVAVRALADFSRANEEREARMEELLEGAKPPCRKRG